MLVELSI